MIYQITSFATYLGQQCLNVFHYQENTGAGALSPSDLDEMLDSFELGVITPIKAVQHANFVYNKFEIKNLSNGVDFRVKNVTIIGTDGATAGTELPSYVTLNFKLNRSSLVVKNGRKAISGLTEARVSGNTYTFSSTPVRTAIETGLGVSLGDGNGHIMEPVIIKRPIPAPGGVFVVSDVASANYVALGTQNSRKAGRGI